MKKSLGQFFTTNYDYILTGMKIPKNVKTIIEPFCGNGDLLNFLDSDYELECYDIDVKQDYIVERDVFMNPPSFSNKFVLTNPPYLAKNKSSDKKIFDKYKQDDLFKCFVSILCKDICEGGIIILPVNFLCASSDFELRKRFITKYDIVRINIFEEKVFKDTAYNVCSILFTKKNSQKDITVRFFPSDKITKIRLDKNNNYTFGGELYNLRPNKYKITRATKLNRDSPNLTKILLKCIDAKEKINTSISEPFIDETPKLSCRTQATLIIEPKIDMKTQKKLVVEFNNYLSEMREKYNSLFLTNFRDKNRKRISFTLAFNIIGHLLETLD